MKYFLLIITVFSTRLAAQHCPWDCSGLLVMQCDLSPAELYRLKPVLVDENQNIVIDTIYGTAQRTWDTAYVLPFAEFQQYRTGRIKEHRWYNYDTLYRFAGGYFVAKVNFCKYAHTAHRLSLRVTLQPPGKNPVFRYVEIPAGKLIHLHDYSIQLNKRDSAGIREAIQPNLFLPERKDLGLQ